MRKIVLCLAFVIAAVNIAAGQAFETVPAPDNSTLVGTINAKLKIRMKLSKQGNNLVGSYAYEAQKKDIPLRGVVNDQGYFAIDEYGAKDAPTGHFIGAFAPDSVVVGFWSKDDSSLSAKLPVRLVQDTKVSVGIKNKFEVVRAGVKADRGSAQILLIDDTVFAFLYENVGGNTHTCTMTIDRSNPGLQWTSDGSTTTINFTKAYFNIDENVAKVVIKKIAAAYTIIFDGYLSYFCGARAMLPQKVTLRKGSKGWIGR